LILPVGVCSSPGVGVCFLFQVLTTVCFFSDRFEVVLSYPPAWLLFPEIADVAVDPNNYANVAVLTNYGEVVFSKNIGYDHNPFKTSLWLLGKNTFLSLNLGNWFFLRQ
jgi:hypothetical protein